MHLAELRSCCGTCRLTRAAYPMAPAQWWPQLARAGGWQWQGASRLRPVALCLHAALEAPTFELVVAPSHL